MHIPQKVEKVTSAVIESINNLQCLLKALENDDVEGGWVEGKEMRWDGWMEAKEMSWGG